MRQDQLGLLGLRVLALLLQVIVLLLQDILFSFELSLHLLDLLVFVGLVDVELLLQSIAVLLDSLDLFLKTSLLRHHALRADLESLVQGVLFLFEPANRALELIDGGGVRLLAFFQLFLELLLELLEDRVVVVLVL